MPYFETQPTLHGFDELPISNEGYELAVPRVKIDAVAERVYDLGEEHARLVGFAALEQCVDGLRELPAMPAYGYGPMHY